MPRLDAFASLPHYADHLWPIWEALPDEVRGEFYSPRDGLWWGDELPRIDTHSTPMMVAGYADAMRVRPRPLVYVEHGAGQTYRGLDHPAYSGGPDLADVVLFICPSETVADRWRARYVAHAVAVGCPRLDSWHAIGSYPAAVGTPAVRRSSSQTTSPFGGGWQGVGHQGVGPEEQSPTVAITFHWDCSIVPETQSAWPWIDPALDRLVAEAQVRGWRLLGHGHPRLWPRIVRRWRALGVEEVPYVEKVFDEADVLVADNTSTMWEFASLDRPLVVVDAPWYRRDVEHGLRFWTHADVGVRVNKREHLVEAVEDALADTPSRAALRDAASREVYAYRDGHAAERAAAAIVELMEGPLPNPLAPRRRPAMSERRSDIETLTERLRALGASPSEVDDFRVSWLDAEKAGEVTPDERKRLHELTMLDDVSLSRMLAVSRGLDPETMILNAPDDERGGVVMGVTDLG